MSSWKFLSPLPSSWEGCPALCSCSVKNWINFSFSPFQASDAEGKAEDVCAGFLQKSPADAAVQAPGKCPFSWSTSEAETQSCCIDIFASSSPVTRLDLHSSGSVDLLFQNYYFWENSGHLGFWFGHCSAWNRFRSSVYVLAVFQLKSQNKNLFETFLFLPWGEV